MFTNDIPGAALRVRANAAAPHEGLGEAVHKTLNMIKVIYDFTVQGGVVGSVNLNDDAGNAAILPTGAVVTKVLAHVITAVTSGGAGTLAATLLAGGDLCAATAVASLTIGAFIDGVPNNTAATAKGPVVSASGTRITGTIAGANLTAGKVAYFIQYVITN